MSQNNSHMDSVGIFVPPKQFSGEGGMFCSSFCCCVTLTFVLWWPALLCCLARERKINTRVKYRDGQREPLTLKGLKAAGISGFLMFGSCAHFSPGSVCIISCKLMQTVHYSFFLGRGAVFKNLLEEEMTWMEMPPLIHESCKLSRNVFFI